MFEIITFIAALSSMIAALYSFLSFKRQKDTISFKYKEIIESYEKILTTHLSETSSTKDIKNFRITINSLLTNAAKTISLMTNKNISASVQLINSNKSIPTAITFARDEKSKKDREIMELEYPLSQNTAFSKLMNIDEEIKYYHVNDLESQWNGIYKNNESRNWKMPYRSVLVVPIKTRSKSSEVTFLGFLSFDSTKADAFNRESISFAVSIAEILAGIFYKMFKISNDEFYNRYNNGINADRKRGRVL